MNDTGTDPDGVLLFEEKHMIATMMFLDENGGCLKSTLYSAVSSNPRMPDKLDRLERNGLIVQITDGRGTRITLTSLGKDVCSLFGRMNGLFDAKGIGRPRALMGRAISSLRTLTANGRRSLALPVH